MAIIGLKIDLRIEKLPLRIEDTRDIAGILKMANTRENTHALLGHSSSCRTFHSKMKSRPLFT